MVDSGVRTTPTRPKTLLHGVPSRWNADIGHGRRWGGDGAPRTATPWQEGPAGIRDAARRLCSRVTLHASHPSQRDAAALHCTLQQRPCAPSRVPSYLDGDLIPASEDEHVPGGTWRAHAGVTKSSPLPGVPLSSMLRASVGLAPALSASVPICSRRTADAAAVLGGTVAQH
jgi:hypothetical protein